MRRIIRCCGARCPFVSIVIVNYNGEKYLKKCIPAIEKINYPKSRREVILVDNGSGDGSVTYVRKNFPNVKILELGRNYGFDEGNNKGASAARGEYIVFLNNDVIVSAEWLLELTKIAVKRPKSILTSKLYSLNDPEVIYYDGSKLTFLGRSVTGARPLNAGRKISIMPESPRQVIYPIGASIMIRKDLFMKQLMFDNDYFISLEDLDIGLRAWLYGYEVIYVPTSIAYHEGSGTVGKGREISDLVIYHSAKNSYMNIIKYFDVYHLLVGVILSIAFYAIEIIFLTKAKRISAVKLILLSHLWVFRNIKAIIEKRLIINENIKRRRKFLFDSRFFASVSESLLEWRRLRRANATL